MRTYLAVTLSAALLTMSVPAQLSAQRGQGGARPSTGGQRPSTGGERPSTGHETVRAPAIPHEPTQRADIHAGPTFEPGRPHGPVPYVRDDHWYGHAAPDDARFHLARPFQFGRFGLLGPGHVFAASRVDLGARRIWLPGGGFQIAAWDWPLTAPWCWTCDDIVVYGDPDHTGWYLLYNVRLGEYAHATFLGA
jgi:hypothetical protein